MPNFVMYQGIPGSGKSTQAKYLSRNNDRLKVINKDSLRAMLDDGKWSRSNEKFIIQVRNRLILAAMDNGYNVISDDTNFHHSHEENFRRMVSSWNTANAAKQPYQFNKEFFPCELETAILRDRARVNSVGEQVIKQMYYRYVYKPEVYKAPAGQPNAICVDLDGTLALIGDRSPYNWQACANDDLCEPVAELLDSYCLPDSLIEILLVSGRDEVCRPETEDWLKRHDVSYSKLFMRQKDDRRPDEVVKREIFDKYIRNEYQVLFVIDDRPRVARLWRELGLFVFQVGNPEVEF